MVLLLPGALWCTDISRSTSLSLQSRPNWGDMFVHEVFMVQSSGHPRLTGMMCLCMGVGSKLWTKQAPASCRQISLLCNFKHVFLYAGDFPLK